MTQDRDPNLGDIGKINVDDKRRGGGGGPPASPGPRRAPPGRGSSGGGQGLWIAAVSVLLVIILVMGAWFFREIRQLQGRLDNRMSQSSQKMGNLESQLSAADENLNQSTGKLKHTLDYHMDQIRKLWDVSNKRNKDWIQGNQSAIASLKKETGKLESSVSGLRDDVSSVKRAVKRAGDDRDQMQTQLDALTESVKQAGNQVSTLKKQLAGLDDIRAENRKMDSRLADVESAIKAFDTWRKQVNNRLDGLESRSTGNRTGGGTP